MRPDIWIDGSFIPWNRACVHPLSHSLQRGATVFESIDCKKTDNGRGAIFRLNDHMERFERSAALIGMPIQYSVEKLNTAVRETVARSGMKSCVIRPLAMYADPVFDVFPGDARVSVVIGIGEKSPQKKAISMMTGHLRKIENISMPVKAKVSGNYIAPMIAKSEAILEGYDDAILLDRNGLVAEGSTSNIFIVENGTIVTTPDDLILLGITRDTVMTISEKEGIRCSIEAFPVERLKRADEVFMCSTGNGIVSVTHVDSAPVGNGRPGPVTRRLRSLYNDITEGRVPGFEYWLTYV